MAEQPKYFDIEDTQTGKKYRIETDDASATYDEAVEYFSTLPETEWKQYEYTTKAPATPAPVQRTEQVAAPATTKTTEEDLKVSSNLVSKGQMGFDTLAEYENYEIVPLSSEDEQTYVRMSEDPRVSLEELQEWATEKGVSLGKDAEENLLALREAKKKNLPVSRQVNYERLSKSVLGDFAPQIDPTIDTDFEAALEKGMAYNPMGIATRALYDFFDIEQGGFDKDALRKQFPDLDDDQIESIHDDLIGEMRRRELINANVQVDERDVNLFVDFAGDIIGGASPVDLIPFGRGSSVGRKLAEAAGSNFAVDAALQAGDISYGAQQKYDPIQGAVAAASGAALQGTIDLGASALKRVVSKSQKPEQPVDRVPIAVPSSPRNTKKYRAELDAAQDGVIAQVDDIRKDWTNSPDVEVYKNFSDLKGIDNSAVGVYTTKTLEDGTTVPVIQINTEAVLARAKSRDVSPESVVEAVTFHEGLGHHGLSSLFREDLDLFLDDIYVKGSEEFRAETDRWLKQNPQAYKKGFTTTERRVRATEEVLAKWSEGGPLPRKILDNIMNLIKDFGRQMGMDLKYTSREVRAFLAVAHDRTIKGNKTEAVPSVPKNYRIEEVRSPSFQADGKTVKSLVAYDEEGRILASVRKRPFESRKDWEARLNKEANNPTLFKEEKLAQRQKYMSGNGPIDPDQLSADDLIEARNALEVLDRIEYTPTVIPVDQLEAEVLGRGINPSDVTRLVGMQPGALVKRLFQYDLAASKIGERVATITMDIETNGLNDTNMANYVKATVAFNDILDKLFDLQGEFGRALAANRRVNYSRKKVSSLKDVLREYDLESLADPETFRRYMAEMNGQMNDRKGKTTLTFGDKAISAVNIPRAIMSSADLSAPLRQGVVFVSYPEYWKSFAKMFTMITPSGERNYGFLMEKISSHPNYELMQKGRIAFSSLDGELSAREEDFQTEWARKIPVFGKVVKGSEQAYAGFLNKLRADMFNRFISEYRKSGIFDGTQKDAEGNLVVTPDEQELLTGLGEFINAGTGRAELPKFLRPSSTIINATFFSGRLMYSRIQMLNPAFYTKLAPPVRKEALRSMLAFGAIASLIAGSINALWSDDVEIETDARSSDFMKIKAGDTRFDIGGGFNQYLILGARTGTWLYNNTLVFGDRQAEYLGLDSNLEDYKVANKKTVSGKYRTYGNDTFGQETYAGAIGQFFRSKLSPQASYVVDGMVGTDYIGREFTLEGSLASRLVPMTANSIYEAYAEDSQVPLPVVGAASLFGVGVNTYTNINEDPDQELEAPVSFKLSGMEDGEDEEIRVENEEVILKKATREKWTATIMNYYPVFLKEITAEKGYKSFDEAPSEIKEEIIKEAKASARREAKKDMLFELELD